MNQTVLIVHNLRSAHNVGALLRTSDGLGVNSVYLTGYTPYPIASKDARMPHVAAKVARQIHKTALGAENTIKWQHCSDISPVISQLKNAGYSICALEQAKNSVGLNKYKQRGNVALILGNEITGVELDILEVADTILEIPMLGAKESFNVAQAAAMALYHLKFYI